MYDVYPVFIACPDYEQPTAEEISSVCSPERYADDDPVRMYLEEIGKVPRLSAEEEQSLPLLSACGDEDAKGRLTEGMLPMVVTIANRYAGNGMLLLDLIEEGNTALSAAVESYTPHGGESFAAYAGRRIDEALRLALLNCTDRMRIYPERLEAIRIAAEASRELKESLGREPSTEELAEKLGVEPGRICPVLILPDKRSDAEEDKEDELLSQLQIQLEEFPDTLSPRERELMRLRLGMTDGRPWTREEVGRHFNVTAERIRRIEAKILRSLNKPRSDRLRDFLN